jgi:ubiquinone/menaquinone biosynthesis C-methylase UbiE
MANEPANDVLTAWETSSQYWTKYQSLIASMFAPLSSALVDAVHIGPGQSILDVGGGSGEPSLTIAPLVGPTGLVTYTDPSAGMVSAAESEANRRGLTNIRFQQCAADQLPFPDSNFDGAVSRLSVMFFPDPAVGLREIIRVLKPGAGLGFVVWAANEFNPFFRVVSEALAKFIPAEVEDDDAPTAFRFARSRKLAELLETAGATGVTERTLNFSIEGPIDIEQFWQLRTEMSDTFRKKLAQLDEKESNAVKAAVQKDVADYFENGMMSFPALALVVSATKP